MICLFDQNLSYETWCKCKIKILLPIEKFLSYNISKVGRKEGKNNCSRAKRMSRKKSKMEKIIFFKGPIEYDIFCFYLDVIHLKTMSAEKNPPVSTPSGEFKLIFWRQTLIFSRVLARPLLVRKLGWLTHTADDVTWVRVASCLYTITVYSTCFS